MPFDYKGVTYAVDIYGNVIAIEQMFSSGEWRSQEVYAMTPGDIFEVTVTEAEDVKANVSIHVTDGQIDKFQYRFDDRALNYDSMLKHRNKLSLNVNHENRDVINLYVQDKKANLELHDKMIQLANEDGPRNYTNAITKGLKIAWFASIESSGGAAEADEHSMHCEERALYHIEQALRELTGK